MTKIVCEAEKQELQLKLNQYSDMLYKFCLLRLQNVQDAEDVVQETFYQYVKREEVFESEEHERAWLIRVAINYCKKLQRSAWNRYRGNGKEDFAELLQDIAKNDSSAEDAVLRAEKNRLILQAVSELPLKYRDVIHLFYYEGMGVKEIAEITERKEATITSQLTRGRKLLKKVLKEDYDLA